MPHWFARSPLVIGIAFVVAGCRSKDPTDSVAPAQEIRALESSGVHNLFRVSDRVYSGSSPDGDMGFASLAKLGVKTIISVDGAKPDVETAARHGMEYVHLPFGYDGIPRQRVLELAKVATARPGPIYVHCHHGLHRGPVAVAVIQICEDPAWNAGTAELWLQQAGTSPQYPGLMHMPRIVVRPTRAELASVPNEFPSITPVNDLASLMVDVDARWDRLKQVKSAGWKTPAAHPDIDPPHEALQLVEHYREASRLESTKKRSAALVHQFNEAESTARELESELRATPVKPELAAAAFARAASSCTACHNQFRDRPSTH